MPAGQGGAGAVEPRGQDPKAAGASNGPAVAAEAAPLASAEHPVDERSGEEPAHPGVSLSPPGVIAESDVRVHSPAAAQPHHHLGIWAEELGELPWSYGDGRLVTLLRDPRTIFVYWDLGQQQIESAFAGLGPARAVLKLWTAPQGGEFLREVEVHLEARGWYVRELPPGVDLRIELWAIGERGARLIRAARPVRLPQAEPSSIWDEIYVNLPLSRRLGRGEPLTGGQPLQWRAGQVAQGEQPKPAHFLGGSELLGGGTLSGGFWRRRPEDDDKETK